LPLNINDLSPSLTENNCLSLGWLTIETKKQGQPSPATQKLLNNVTSSV